MSKSELRVHGVSGTPPRDMLYTEPVTYDQSEEHAKVYRERLAGDFDTEAFHWGSLTAGHWSTAFWILLAPFAFANVAGWMAGGQRKPTRAVLRLAGLALTMLMVVQGGVVMFDIGFSWAATTQHPKGWLLGLIIVFALFVWSIMGWLSTQSHFQHLGLLARLRLTLAPWPDAVIPPGIASRGSQWRDPAGKTIDDPEVWGVHSILHRMRRLHLSLSYLAIALLLELGAGESPVMSLTSIGLVGVVCLLTSFIASNWLTRWSTALLPLGSLVVVTVASARIMDSLPAANGWPHIHRVTFTTAVVLGALTLLIPITAIAAGGLDSTAIMPVGVIVVGAFVGASYGIGTALIVGQLFGIDRVSANGADWVAIAMLGLVVWATLIGLILSMFGRSGDEPDVPWFSSSPRLRRIVVSGPYLLYALAFYGLVVGAVAWVKACTGLSCDPRSLGSWPEKWTTDLFTFTKFGYTFDLGNPVWIAKLLLIVGPAFLIGRRLLFGARDAEKRRQVGILWDIGSFWPRWYHPLAPPAYGPNAVTRLRLALSDPSSAWRGIDPNASPSEGRLDVLSAHSQGSLVAAVAMSLVAADAGTETKLPGGFVTYGSQLGLLYPSMFPGVGVEKIVSLLADRLRDRWINLWRPDDPIGGHYVDALGDANWRVSTGSGHSRYELTHEFCVARSQILQSNIVMPAREVMMECWEPREPEG